MDAPLFPSSDVVVSRDEFNAFHKIDRSLFTRLVFGLNRDVTQSTQVIAFLYLLEQLHHARNLIFFLCSLPDSFVDAVANEIYLCVRILISRAFSTAFLANNGDDQMIIPLTLSMTSGKLTVRFIHENRQSMFLRLRHNLAGVCARAFGDLVERAERRDRERLLALENERAVEEMRRAAMSAQQEIGSSSSSSKEETQKVAEKVEEEPENEQVVPADDRTVFLTFSKGYPLSEEEVSTYFTRRFGDVFEAVAMQQPVEDNEQPLWARMVLKVGFESMIEEIVTAKNKNKFTINGKHVLARKYIPKNPAVLASSSASQI